MSGIDEGQPIPEFDLPASGGSNLSSEGLKGSGFCTLPLPQRRHIGLHQGIHRVHRERG